MDNVLRNLPVTKKERERVLLDSFIARLHPTTKRTVEEWERPDFRIRCEGCSIGVEITELHWDGKPRHGSQHRRAVAAVERLERALNERGINNACISIDGGPGAIAKGLDAALHPILSHLGENRTATTLAFRLPEDISVDVREATGKSRVRWTGIRTGEIDAGVIRESLRKVIVSKMEKANGFTANDALWLIVCAVPTTLASTVVITEPADLVLANTSPYSDVLLWDAFTESVWTIGPRPQLLVDPEKKEVCVAAFSDASRRALWGAR